MLPSNKVLAEFLSPSGNDRGAIRTDFDLLRRERVLVLNDTINAISRAGEAMVSMEDADGTITAALLLDRLLVELDDSIFEDTDG